MQLFKMTHGYMYRQMLYINALRQCFSKIVHHVSRIHYNLWNSGSGRLAISTPSRLNFSTGRSAESKWLQIMTWNKKRIVNGAYSFCSALRFPTRHFHRDAHVRSWISICNQFYKSALFPKSENGGRVICYHSFRKKCPDRSSTLLNFKTHL